MKSLGVIFACVAGFVVVWAVVNAHMRPTPYQCAEEALICAGAAYVACADGNEARCKQTYAHCARERERCFANTR